MTSIPSHPGQGVNKSHWEDSHDIIKTTSAVSAQPSEFKFHSRQKKKKIQTRLNRRGSAHRDSAQAIAQSKRHSPSLAPSCRCLIWCPEFRNAARKGIALQLLLRKMKLCRKVRQARVYSSTGLAAPPLLHNKNPVDRPDSRKFDSAESQPRSRDLPCHANKPLA